MSGIPEDKTLLNPVLIGEYINNGTITNYTDPYNKKQNSIYFEAESIGSTISKEGQYKILGTVNQDIEFTL